MVDLLQDTRLLSNRLFFPFYRAVLCQQADKLEAYLETCNRIAAYADEDGGYENLLDSAVFEDAQA